LVIDEDHKFLQELAGLLVDKPWEVSVELTGGSGLDRASTFQFQIVAVRDQLMDLPGQMVIKSAQDQNSKTLGIVYSARGEGRLERYEGGRVTQVEQPLKGAPHLVATLESMVNELLALRRERRYLQAFRTDHPDFLKRYAELKARIDQLA
jgi:DNA-binding NtrC family response regulator